MRPADRIDGVKDYYFATKLAEIRKRRESGEQIINLGIGSPDISPPTKVIDSFNTALSHKEAFAYKPYKGIPGLKETMAKWYDQVYNVDLAPAMCLPLIGSKEGIGFISLAYLNPGDEVLVPDPGYLAYSSAAKLAGAIPVPYSLDARSGWMPRLDELNRLLSPRTKIVWLNFPSMPAGVAPDIDLLSRVVGWAERNDILVVNDNPYSLVLYENHFSIHQLNRNRSVLELNSMSKAYNLAGMRLGMLTGDPALLNLVFRVQSNLASGMFEPSQKAAITAMSLGPEWLATLNKTYSVRRKVAEGLLTELDCAISGSEGGLFLWAKIPETHLSEIDFSEYLLDEYKIFLAPGSVFGSQGKGYVRLSLCSNIEMLEEARQRITTHKSVLK